MGCAYKFVRPASLNLYVCILNVSTSGIIKLKAFSNGSVCQNYDATHIAHGPDCSLLVPLRCALNSYVLQQYKDSSHFKQTCKDILESRCESLEIIDGQHRHAALSKLNESEKS